MIPKKYEYVFLECDDIRNECYFCEHKRSFIVLAGDYYRRLQLCLDCFVYISKLPKFKNFKNNSEKIEIILTRIKESAREYRLKHPDYVERDKISRRARHLRDQEKRDRVNIEKRLKVLDDTPCVNTPEEWRKIDEEVILSRREEK